MKKGEKGQLVSSIAFIDDGCLAIASRTVSCFIDLVVIYSLIQGRCL